jgi:RimJ/RimL family protein N-acetyltransferase
MGSGVGGGVVEPGGDLGSRGPAVPPFERRAVVAGGHEELFSATMHALALRLDDEPQRAAEVGHRRATLGDGPAGALEFGESPLDPWAQLAHGRGRLAFRGAARKHDLDAARRIDGDANPARSLGAADPIRERLGGAANAGPGEERRKGLSGFFHAAATVPCASDMPAILRLDEPLSDGHVRIRPAAERDIPEVLIAHQDDPRLAPLLGLERPPSGAELGRAMEEAETLRAAGTAVTLTILEADTDECRGQIHAHHFDWEHVHADLDIWVAPDARGLGLGHRALTLAATWLLDACGLQRVQLLTLTDNEPAIRTALAAGFVNEGVLRSHARLRGARVDLTVLSRIASGSARR